MTYLSSLLKYFIFFHSVIYICIKKKKIPVQKELVYTKVFDHLAGSLYVLASQAVASKLGSNYSKRYRGGHSTTALEGDSQILHHIKLTLADV